MLRREIAVDVDESGQPVVRFPDEQGEYDPPTEQRQRLEWIRLSCERFFEKVRERNAIQSGVETD